MRLPWDTCALSRFGLCCYVIKAVTLSHSGERKCVLHVKMVRTSDFVKLRALSLLKKGKTIAGTVRELKEVDGVSINRKTVAKLLRKMKTNSSIADKARSGRPSKLSQEHFDFIDRKLEENDELTAPGMF